jgi:hypothetical protein
MASEDVTRVELRTSSPATIPSPFQDDEDGAVIGSGFFFQDSDFFDFDRKLVLCKKKDIVDLASRCIDRYGELRLLGRFLPARFSENSKRLRLG